MTARTLIGLAVVSLLVASVSAQSCVQYSSTLAPTLKGVIPEGTWIYTPTGSLAPLEAKVAPFALALGSLTPGCRDAAARMVAAQAFMKCNEQIRLAGFAMPRLPCRSSCDAVVAACPPLSPDWVLLTLLFQKPVDQVCTGTGLGGLLPGYADFPSVCSNFTVGPQTVCSPCNQIDTPINVLFGTCMDYNGTVCKGVISGSVYSPAGLCQQNIEDRLSNLPNVFASLTSMTCRSAAAKALCNSAFPKCDNTSATNLLQFAATSYLQPLVAQTLPPGFPLNLRVPTVVLPRFPNRQFCWNMHDQCMRSAGASAPEWIPGFNAQSQLGLYLNAVMDGNKLRVLLASNWPRPQCDQDVNPPIGQLDWPDGPTTFGGATINGTTYPVTSQPNPFYDPSNTIQPNIPVCANFDSADLAANTPPALGETSSLSYCKNIIPEGFSVFVPSGKTMYDLNKLARSAHFLFGLMPVKEGCNIAFAKFACWQIFNPCKNDTFTATLPTVPQYLANHLTTPITLATLKVITPFPRFPCKNICEDYETRCAAFFVDNPSAKPNCTQAKNAPSGALPGQSKTYECDFVTLKTPGQPDFPARGATAAGTTYFTRLVFPLAPLNQTVVTNQLVAPMNESLPAHVLDATLQTTCNGDPQDSALATNPTIADLPVICPWPTLHPSTMKYGKTVSPDFVGLGGGYCGQPCPGFLYTEDTYEANFQMFSALSIISFVLLAWMLLTWTCFKEKRDKINVYCFLICTFGVSIVGMISVIWGAREVTCASSVEEAKMGRHDSTLCVVQGAILVYFGLAACLWWAIQATNIFIDVNWKKRITNTIAFRLRVVYTLIGFGFPVITVVSMLATDNIGHANAIAFCAGTGLVWPLFYGPIAVCILIGTLGMLFIIGTIWKSTKKTAKTTAGSQIRVLIRPLLFVLTFLLCFTMVFLYRVYGDIGGDTIKNSITDWVKCYLVTAPTARYRNDTMPLGCDARPSEAPNATYYNLIHIAIGAQGLFVFLIYGTETEQFGLWAQLCGCKAKKTADTSDERTRGTTRTTSVVGGSQGGSRGGGKQTLRVPRGDGEGGSREGSRNNSKHDPEENKLVTSSGPSDTDQVRVEMQPASTGMAPAPSSDSNAGAISYPPPPVPGGDSQAMVPPPLDG